MPRRWFADPTYYLAFAFWVYLLWWNKCVLNVCLGISYGYISVSEFDRICILGVFTVFDMPLLWQIGSCLLQSCYWHGKFVPCDQKEKVLFCKQNKKLHICHIKLCIHYEKLNIHPKKLQICWNYNVLNSNSNSNPNTGGGTLLMEYDLHALSGGGMKRLRNTT